MTKGRTSREVSNEEKRVECYVDELGSSMYSLQLGANSCSLHHTKLAFSTQRLCKERTK